MLPTVPKAVLFDIDGTLLDHRVAAVEAVLSALARTHPRSNVNGIERQWLDWEKEFMDRYLVGEISFIDQRRRRVAALAQNLFQQSWSAEDLDQWFAQYLKYYEASWQTYPDVEPCLSALSQHRPAFALGVLTNGEAQQQRRKLAHVGIADLLPVVIASSEVGAAKPDPLIFQIAADRLGLPAASIIYVGDRREIDAKAAAQAGLMGVWLDRDRDPTERPSTETDAHYIHVASLNELTQMVLRSG